MRFNVLEKCVDHSATLGTVSSSYLFTKCKDLPATLESIDFNLLTTCVDLSATLVSLNSNLLTKCVDLSATLQSIRFTLLTNCVDLSHCNGEF